MYQKGFLEFSKGTGTSHLQTSSNLDWEKPSLDLCQEWSGLTQGGGSSCEGIVGNEIRTANVAIQVRRFQHNLGYIDTECSWQWAPFDVSRQVNDMMKAVLWEEKSRGGSQDPSFCSSCHCSQHYPAVDSLSSEAPTEGLCDGKWYHDLWTREA